MSFEGNSGPYIQYAYVRAVRILEKENYIVSAGLHTLQGASFNSDSEIDLAKKIMNFNNILEKSAFNNYPHIIAEYAYDLTKSFSNFYNNVSVKDEENEENKKLKLILVDSFAKTLKEVFELL
jgi:arginyl-tRNA synthetase